MQGVVILIGVAIVILVFSGLAIWGQKHLHGILDSFGSVPEADPAEIEKEQRKMEWVAEHYYHQFVSKKDRAEGVFRDILQEEPDRIVQEVFHCLDHILLVYVLTTEEVGYINDKEAFARDIVEYLVNKYLKGESRPQPAPK